MKFNSKLNKYDKKGFTLVELIVVLVILAILATLLIPTLTGYIDKAKEKNVIAQTRSILSALQTEVDDAYGTDPNHWVSNNLNSHFTFASKDGSSGLMDTTKLDSTILKESYEDIVNLAEASNIQTGNGYFAAVVTPQGKVHFILYNDGKGHTGLYFNETQEYLVYKTKDLQVENYDYYKNKVVCTPVSDVDGSITGNSLWSKKFILYSLGVSSSYQ